jgi:hypothetical protein
VSGLYSYNANIKYPLSDFHEADVPNDILSDLTVSVGPDYDPVVGAIRVTPFTAFVAIQNRPTGESLAVAAVMNPIPGRVYPLEMDVDGFGWIVFGPGGRARQFYTGAVEIDLDPEVHVELKNTAPLYAIKEGPYTYDAVNILKLLSTNNVVSISVEGNTIYIDRNDAALTEDQIAGFTNVLGEDTTTLVFTIAGARADDDGNIDIDVVGVVQPCNDVWELEVPRGDNALGTNVELPLDKFSPRLYTEGNSCVDPESSEFPETGDDPQTIIKEDILDRADDHPVGTLYKKDPNG